MIKNIKDLSDSDLVLNVQKDNCSESAQELISRHSKLYYNCVHKFIKKYPEANLNDLLDDISIVFERAMRTFNPKKDAKFTTWLFNLSRFHCLNINKNKGKTLNFELKDIDLINSSQNKFVEHSLSKEDTKNYIFSILAKLKDKRIIKIFELRYITGGKNNKIMPWKMVSKKMKLSITHCINLESRALKLLHQKLTGDNLFDKI